MVRRKKIEVAPSRISPPPRVQLSPEAYQDLKRRVYVRQGGRCAGCGRARQLDLHHKRGRGVGGGYRRDTDEDTVGICSECHPKWDNDRDSKFGGVNETS